MLIFHSGMRVKHINSEYWLAVCVRCAHRRVSKTISPKLTCTFQTNSRRTHTASEKKKRTHTLIFSTQVDNPFAQTTLRITTSRFTLWRHAANICCCCCWQITWKVLLASETSPPLGLSAPHSHFWCSSYLLVLFIAEFSSVTGCPRRHLSVSLRLHAWPLVSPHPLSVVLRLRLSPWTAESTWWRADGAEERPPTY